MSEKPKKNKKRLLFPIIALLILCVLSPSLFVPITVGFVIVLIIKRFTHYITGGKFKPIEGEQYIFLWGMPGSGKSTFLTKFALDAQNQGFVPYFNRPNTINPDIYTREDLARYDFGKNAVNIYDEASIDGFDNRNHAKNFAGPIGEKLLYKLKYIRHFENWLIFANQGFNEIDLKIRDMCSVIYYTECKHFFGKKYCTATRMIKELDFDDNGQPIYYYSFPPFFDRIRDPSFVMYADPKKYGGYFDTYEHKKLPAFSERRKARSAVSKENNG